jgi:hypothetical protein
VPCFTPCLRQWPAIGKAPKFDMVGHDEDADAPCFPQIINPHKYAKAPMRTEFFSLATKLARQVLGPKARFSDDHALMKPATSGPPTPWHQDEAFRDPRYDYREVSIWLALQPVDWGPTAATYCRTARAVIQSSTLWNAMPAMAVPCPLPAGGWERLEPVGCGGHRYDRSRDVDLGVVDALGIAIDRDGDAQRGGWRRRNGDQPA